MLNINLKIILYLIFYNPGTRRQPYWAGSIIQ